MYLGKSSLVCNALAVNGVTTVYSNNFQLFGGVAFGIQVICATSSTPAIQIQLEESIPGLDLTDAAQGASNSLYVMPDNFGDIFSDIVDKIYHIKPVFPVPASYGRYKINGLTGNPSDTTVTIYNFVQEPGRSYGG